MSLKSPEHPSPRRLLPFLCGMVLLLVLCVQVFFLFNRNLVKIPAVLSKLILESNLPKNFQVRSGTLSFSLPNYLFLENVSIQEGRREGLNIFLTTAVARLNRGTLNLKLHELEVSMEGGRVPSLSLEGVRLEKKGGPWLLREARLETDAFRCFLKQHPDFSGATLSQIVFTFRRFFKQLPPQFLLSPPKSSEKKFLSIRPSFGKNIGRCLTQLHRWQSSFRSAGKVELALYLEEEGMSLDFWAEQVGFKKIELRDALGRLSLPWEADKAVSLSAYAREGTGDDFFIGKNWNLSAHLAGRPAIPYLQLSIDDCQINRQRLGELTADVELVNWKEGGIAKSHFLLFKEGLVFSGEGIFNLKEKTLSAHTRYNLDVPKALGRPLSLEKFLEFPFTIKTATRGYVYLKVKEDLSVEEGQVRMMCRDIIFDQAKVDLLRLQGSISRDFFTIDNLRLEGEQLRVDFSGFQNFKEDFGNFSLEGRLRPGEYSSFFDQDLKDFVERFSFPKAAVEVGLFLKTQGHSLKTYTYQNIYASLKAEEFILENLPVKSLSLDVWANREWLTVRNLESVIEDRHLLANVYINLDKRHDTKQLVLDLESNLSVRDVLLIIEEKKVPAFVADMDAPIYLNCLALVEVNRKTGHKDLYLRSEVNTPSPIWAGNIKADYLKADIYQTPQALVLENLKMGLGGGSLQGRVSLFPKQKKDFEGNLSFTDVDLAKLAEHSIKKSSFPLKQGILKGKLKLSGNHLNQESFTGNLSAKLKDLELFRFAIFGDLSETLGIGLIDFKEFRGDFIIREGNFIVQSARMKTPLSELKILGYYDFVKDHLDFVLETRPFKRLPLVGGLVSGLLTPVAAALRVALRGPLKKPQHRVMPFTIAPSPSPRPKLR